MANEPAAELGQFKNPDTVPFIYFDLAPNHGVMNGSVQIELVARTISPGLNGGTRVEFIGTAHLRCSPTAAAYLRDAIDKALKMLAQPSSREAADKLSDVPVQSGSRKRQRHN